MARAKKIYVVMQGYELLGAFTVKHELYTFAARANWYHAPNIKVLEVPDGLAKVLSFKTYPLVRPNAEVNVSEPTA